PSEADERARRERIEGLRTTRAEAHMNSSATGPAGGRTAGDGVLDAEIVDDARDDTASREAGAARDADVVEETYAPEDSAPTEHANAPSGDGDSPVPDGSPDEAEAPAERLSDEAGEQGARGHRPGRGGFDPEADAAASAARYRTRQRAVLSLGAGVVVTALFAVIVTSAFWWATLACVAALGLYLTYLRRQVRMEQQIRRRRMARLQRSRKQADEQQRTRDTVPSAPTREGVVVLEADDEDPSFDHLPPFEDAARAEEPPEGMRRAAGQ